MESADGEEGGGSHSQPHLEPEENGQLPWSPSIFSKLLSLQPPASQAMHTAAKGRKATQSSLFTHPHTPSRRVRQPGLQEVSSSGTAQTSGGAEFQSSGVLRHGQPSSHSAAVSSQGEMLGLGYPTASSAIPQHSCVSQEKYHQAYLSARLALGGIQRWVPFFSPTPD